jgi:hypothetical protein
MEYTVSMRVAAATTDDLAAMIDAWALPAGTVVFVQATPEAASGVVGEGGRIVLSADDGGSS